MVDLAVILAAGKGTRLYPLSKDIPKCLLPLNGETILDYQLAALQENGINQVVIVTGYLEEQLRNAASGKAKFVHNPEFASTNNLYSLWQARHEFRGKSFVCLHADLLFHPRILHRCLRLDGDVVLAVDKNMNDETMRVRFRKDGSVKIRKGIPSNRAFGTFLGMALFSSRAVSYLETTIGELLIEGQNRDSYFTVAVERLSKNNNMVQASITSGLPWIEIDNLADLEIARLRILPSLFDTDNLSDGII